MLKLVTPPATEPLTLLEAKNHLRVDIPDDDSFITTIITVARQRAEDITRTAFITQTWELSIDSTDDVIYLPRPPTQAISSITLDGVTVDPSQYQMDGSRIFFLTPTTATTLGGIKITFTAGYGNTANDVPTPIKQAILQITGHLYENRESQDMPPLAMDLLQPYKVYLL